MKRIRCESLAWWWGLPFVPRSGIIAVNCVLVEMSGFAASREDYFGSDDEFAAFQTFLMSDPLAGQVIKDSGGLRKIRWRRVGHGRRGGLRIIYLNLPQYQRLYLLDVYAKAEQDDLTADERHQLAAVAEAVRAALAARLHRSKL